MITVTFDEEELSRDYTEMATGGPTFDTGIIGNRFGIQQRAIRRQDAIRTWDIEFGGMSEEQKVALETFFISKYGSGIGFRFFPPGDFQFRGDLIGVTNASNEYKLYRDYVTPSRTIRRRILKLVENDPEQGKTLAVAVGVTILAEKASGSPGYVFPDVIPSGYFLDANVPPTVAIEVNYDTGTFSFATTSPFSLPANGYTLNAVGGYYDVPVTFDTDNFEVSDYGVFKSLDSIRVTELLPVALGLE